MYRALISMIGSLGLTVVVLMVPTTGSARFPWATGPFCAGQTTAPFLHQLERIPALREPPEFDRLGPWAPGSVYLSGAETIQSAPASVGWALQYGILPRRLDWVVTAKVRQVTGNGTAFGPVRVKQLKVGRPGRETFSDLSFRVSKDPAIYKVSIAFRNAGGKLLSRFSRYFRVMRPRSKARLRLDRPVSQPEERIRARVENLGTEYVSYGVPFRIERLDGGVWTTAPESPTGPWIMPLWASPPGRSGNCNLFWIPEGTPPGTYRFAKRLQNPPTTLYAPFQVLPPE